MIWFIIKGCLTLPHMKSRHSLKNGPILKSKGVPETREQTANDY